MESKLFIIIPVMGALIGWITNVIAIKLIFRPYEPVKLPVINFSIQGIIPKRRYEIAASIGKIVEEELFSMKDLIPACEHTINETVLIQDVASVIKSNLISRIPGIFPNKLKVAAGNMVENILIKELNEILPNLVRQKLEGLGSNVDIRSVVEEKINNLELAGLENLIVSTTRRELKYIEYLGGVLGFIIGLVQVLIIMLLLM